MDKLTPRIATGLPPACELATSDIPVIDGLQPSELEAVVDLQNSMAVRDLPDTVHGLSLLEVMEKEYSGIESLPDPLRTEAEERRRVAMICAEVATMLLQQGYTGPTV